MTIIHHLLTAADWEHAVAVGSYHPSSLDNEGFIHAAYPHQTLDVANILYSQATDLVLICIDLDKVTAKFQEDMVEFPPGVQSMHPHFYEALNINSVVQVVGFPLGADNSFHMPPDVLILSWDSGFAANGAAAELSFADAKKNFSNLGYSPLAGRRQSKIQILPITWPSMTLVSLWIAIISDASLAKSRCEFEEFDEFCEYSPVQTSCFPGQALNFVKIANQNGEQFAHRLKLEACHLKRTVTPNHSLRCSRPFA